MMAERHHTKVPKSDSHTEAMSNALARHEGWRAVSRRIKSGAKAKVVFSHRPGDPWHVVWQRSGSLLRPGPVVDPDAAFLLTPGSIARLSTLDGGIPEIGSELAALLTHDDSELRMDLRITAPLSKLIRHGYVRLLLEAAAGGLTFDGTSVPTNPWAIRRFVAEFTGPEPAWWESGT